MATQIDDFETLPLSPALIADLRSDHAGECGAVTIYEGILAISRDAGVRRFARTHLETERRHRDFFEDWLPRQHRSRLLPVWKLAGWILGGVSALFGPRVVFRTIAAVETFVEDHYLEQIEKMRASPELVGLADKLWEFCEEEVEHRDDAAERLQGPPGGAARVWSRLVGGGSSLGVAIARRV